MAALCTHCVRSCAAGRERQSDRHEQACRGQDGVSRLCSTKEMAQPLSDPHACHLLVAQPHLHCVPVVPPAGTKEMMQRRLTHLHDISLVAWSQEDKSTEMKDESFTTAVSSAAFSHHYFVLSLLLTAFPRPFNRLFHLSSNQPPHGECDATFHCLFLTVPLPFPHHSLVLLRLLTAFPPPFSREVTPGEGGGSVTQASHHGECDAAFHCLCLTFHCLQLPSIDLSLPLIDLSTTFHCLYNHVRSRDHRARRTSWTRLAPAAVSAS